MSEKTLKPVQKSTDGAPLSYYRELEIDTLARTAWGEARGEGADGMAAVAAVIINRVRVARERGGMWWGNNIIQVCQKPYQFSCWNRTDANFEKLQAVTDKNIQFATALRLARRALYGRLDDPTAGATHYHAAGIAPHWAEGAEPVATIGRHVFYRLES